MIFILFLTDGVNFSQIEEHEKNHLWPPINYSAPQQPQAHQLPPQKRQHSTPTAQDIICRYPKKLKGHTIHQYHLEYLEDGRFMNDSMINFVLAWIQGETIGEFRSQVRICDTQWFTRLTRGGHTTENILENINQTKRWFPPTGHPFDSTVVVVPICLEHHWLAVVAIEREGELSLIIMDSMKSPRMTTIRTVLDVVVEQCRPDVPKHWYIADVTQQDNLVDCGVHLINNVTRLLQHLASGIYKDLVEIEEQMKRAQNSIRREDIRALINSLAQGLTPPSIFSPNPLDILLGDLEVSGSEDENEEEEEFLELSPGTEVEDGQVTLVNATNQPWRIGERVRQWTQETVAAALQEMVEKNLKQRRFRHQDLLFRLKMNSRTRVILSQKNIYNVHI